MKFLKILLVASIVLIPFEILLKVYFFLYKWGCGISLMEASLGSFELVDK